MDKIQLFENQKIRSAWDAETEEWYFSVQDIVAVLTDTVDAKDYIKKMRKRDPELNSNWGTICPLVEMQAADGKKRKIQAATMQGMFRIIQSIPSPKAEPFKIWMAEVAKERIDQVQNPELSIEQAMRDYRHLGYSEEWLLHLRE
jgi:prophage antirepressor-like protein